ncbi:MAG: hypothetical protein JSU00_13840 [Acidobacteria bacterium]|nr:hypothetical protein [Acidobacteriota bacterium]
MQSISTAADGSGPLTSMIQVVSNLLASDQPTQAALNEAAATIHASVRASHTRIVFRRGPEVCLGATPLPEAVRNIPIRFRRLQLGTLEVAGAATYPESTTSEALRAAAQLLANWRRQQELEDKRDRLSDQLAQSMSETSDLKLLARAGGIVAARRNISLERARAWIRTEAVSRQCTVTELAGKIVLDNELDRRIASGILPVRKLA